MDTVDELRERLIGALRAALSMRDSAAVSALRTLLGALDNATAVDVATTPAGATEVPRRVLDLQEARAIVQSEQDARRQAVATYERLGRNSEAARLRHELEIVERLLSG